MKQILFLFLAILFTLNAQTIDKEKVLAIIKAAKNNHPIKKVHDEQKTPFIVYRKKPTSHISKVLSQPILVQSSLPNIPPTSILLRNRFSMPHNHIEEIHATPLFKNQKQAKHQEIKTKASKITYY